MKKKIYIAVVKCFFKLQWETGFVSEKKKTNSKKEGRMEWQVQKQISNEDGKNKKGHKYICIW